MSSLVERLRVRSDRRPIYSLDESDDDADFLSGKSGKTEENLEKIVRTDVVSFLLFNICFYVSNNITSKLGAYSLSFSYHILSLYSLRFRKKMQKVNCKERCLHFVTFFSFIFILPCPDMRCSNHSW